MEFLNDLTQDLHTAQDAWNEEAARRTESMSVLCHSTEKERRALSQLVSDVEKLLAYVDSFTRTYRAKFASFRSAETRIAQGITQNANILSELFDPLAKTTLVNQLAANANLNEFLKPKMKEIRIQTFISSTRCRLKTLASSLDIEPPEQQPMNTNNHQVPAPSPSSYPSSFEQPVKTSNIAWSIACNLETQYHIPDPSIDLEYAADTPVEDLLPLFLVMKKQELNTVLKVVEDFRIDGQRIATQVKEANENLQGRRESHQERLDVLNDYADNIVKQVEHKLKIFRKRSSTETIASRIFLEFGQALTTEYLDALWSTALQVMLSHVPEDSGNIKLQIIVELRCLNYTVDSHCENFAAHLSFMRTLSANYPELGDALLSRGIPSANKEADVCFAPGAGGCLELVSNVSKNDAVCSGYESRFLAAELARLVKNQITSTAEVAQPTLLSPTDKDNCKRLQCDSDGAVQVVEKTRENTCTDEKLGRENTRTDAEIRGGTEHRRYLSNIVHLNETLTTLISRLWPNICVNNITYLWKTLIPTQSLSIPTVHLHSWSSPTISKADGDNPVEIAADSSWDLSAFRNDTVYYWTALVSLETPLVSIARKIFTSVRYLNNTVFQCKTMCMWWITTRSCIAIICHFIGNGHIHTLSVIDTARRQQWTLKWAALVSLLARASLGSLVLMDRLILEVSHKYLSFEFWQMLRHDENRSNLNLANAKCARFLANACYLAIAHGTCVDIWDLKDTIGTIPLVRYENENQICSITWSSKMPQLVICFEGGLIYVVTLKEQSSLIVGFQHSAGRQEAKVSAVFLSKDLLAVAMGKTVEIRRCHIGDGESLLFMYPGIPLLKNTHPRTGWTLLATLPPPPIVKEPENYTVNNIHSVHAIAENCILLSYANGLAILWSYSYLQSESNPMMITFQHKDTTLLPGVITVELHVSLEMMFVQTEGLFW
ncbi:hypothetical protein F5877DRAFT_71983 [Lentinula edodes]|nr:hypothetical protein F5877DRAFT_71983 [Lentinula edodes]